LFLFLEYGGVILMDKVVALVREDGRTKILLRDNSAAESGFTPQVLEERGRGFLGGQNVKKSLEGGWKGKH
jgi:hypothetical protein